MFTRNEERTTGYRSEAQFPVKRPTSICAATAQSAEVRGLYPLFPPFSSIPEAVFQLHDIIREYRNIKQVIKNAMLTK